MRILIYTGKGGVGKTSMAAAAACRLAQSGRRVLIMSTDQAHSLGDSFDVRLGDEPKQIAENLQALEIDTSVETRKAWGSLQDYMKEIINKKTQGKSLEVDEVLALPTLDELFAMLRVLDVYRENSCDDLLIDCAPTGETLALLRFPERLGQMVKRLLPFVRAFTFSAGFVVSKATNVPKPSDKVFRDFSKLTDRLMELQKIMSDPDITSIRIVTTPERIVLEEARRNYTWMHMYGFNVDAVIINRIYPESAMKGYFSTWIDVQRENLKLAKESFPGVKVFTMDLKDHELRGMEALSEAAGEVYKDTDLEEVFVKEEIFHIENEDGYSVLVINLPYASADEISVGQMNGDILLTLRNERRRFQIPETVRERNFDHFEYKSGLLKVYLNIK